ncbi:MAG: NUDIX domain-containing protein [Gemmatimonadetes bacterium]|nr:NUDIX domain-containing protein [Gemmatimonadota bacterium]
MTHFSIGVVDVYPVVRDAPGAWRVLLLERARGARSPGAWEVVHGKIEHDESPPEAARRELREETGLVTDRLYSISAHPFYVGATDTVYMAVTFAAFVDARHAVRLGSEHAAHAWLPFDDAIARATWPRLESQLHAIAKLLATCDAGPAEDVLRCP